VEVPVLRTVDKGTKPQEKQEEDEGGKAASRREACKEGRNQRETGKGG
jgi:hypothetical protein